MVSKVKYNASSYEKLSCPGECYTATATECSARNGVYSSTCGNGIGVCCFIVQTSGEEDTRVTRNNTYIRSPGYPGTTMASATYSHTITPVSSSIGQIRFDFKTFQIEGPTTTRTPLGDCLIDTMTIREASNKKPFVRN